MKDSNTKQELQLNSHGMVVKNRDARNLPNNTQMQMKYSINQLSNKHQNTKIEQVKVQQPVKKEDT